MSTAAPTRPRSIVCLSGGMDSCVTAALAARDTDAYGLHFSYGQRGSAFATCST
jgi:7-cyano-7-deazaguanine synthase